MNLRSLARLILPPLALALAAPAAAPGQEAEDLPVRIPDLAGSQAYVRNPLTFEELTRIVGPSPDGRGLLLDLGDASLEGTIYSGPWPFEAGRADYDHACFRAAEPLREGRGTIRIDRFFDSRYNANAWPEGQHREGLRPTLTVAWRLALHRIDEGGRLRNLGFYDALTSFRRLESGGFEKALTITEGPIVALVSSEDPSRLTIAFETDEPARGTVLLLQGPSLETATAFGPAQERRRHEIALSGLEPDRDYEYVVRAEKADGESALTCAYSLRTAPPRGHAGRTRFGFISDTRQGYGGGERACAGHNRHVLSRLATAAYRADASFLLVGGDLVNGDTSSVEDFRLQLRAWKGTMAGYLRRYPVYPIMGNHERLVHAWQDGLRRVWLDRFPYATESAEAIFAEQFWNPADGPAPSDPRRPPYEENVYSFQYGPTLVLALNNNYWWSSSGEVPGFGGSPEGYVLEDQLEWIERRLAAAEADPSVRFVILYAQEPVFPCGGHVGDAMWWSGDNTVRAWTLRGGEMEPASLGMVEVRNRLWRAVAGCSKVAALLAGDEHAYHRLRIDRDTPVGVVALDDADGDGKLERSSPDPGFAHPTWQITAGTGGAPYYNRQPTPWEPVVFDSQSGWVLFETEGERMSMTFISTTGQVVDRVEDLMAIKGR